MGDHVIKLTLGAEHYDVILTLGLIEKLEDEIANPVFLLRQIKDMKVKTSELITVLKLVLSHSGYEAMKTDFDAEIAQKGITGLIEANVQILTRSATRITILILAWHLTLYLALDRVLSQASPSL